MAEQDDFRLNSDDAKGVLENTSCAMDQLYKLEIIHRDITPYNLWQTTEGVWKLSGFDHAIIGPPHVEEHACARPLKQLEYPYGSPEATHGDAGSKQDLWNIGVLFYEITCGMMPKR